MLRGTARVHIANEGGIVHSRKKEPYKQQSFAVYKVLIQGH